MIIQVCTSGVIPDRREPYRRVPLGRVHLDERRLDEVQQDEDRIDEFHFIRHRIGEFYLSSMSGGLRVSICI